MIFTLQDHISTDAFIHQLQQAGILVLDFGPQKIRMITHLDFGEEELDRVIDVLKGLF